MFCFSATSRRGACLPTGTSIASFKDTMLALDLGRHDSLYKFQRASGTNNRVAYVTLNDPDIIPEDDFKRTYGPSIVKELSKLPEWNSSFTTLVVHKNGERIWCEADTFRPHAVPKQYILDRHPAYDVFNMTHLDRVRDRVSKAVLDDGRACFLKVAHFAHELPFLICELEAYHCLENHQSKLAPNLLGYVYEESRDRVIGFLVEPVERRVAGISDLEACSKALGELRRILIHGDLCKYNILITPDGPKFIAFECSTILTGTEEEEVLKSEGKQTLAAKLNDESGVGRPLSSESQL
ncbi:hypothetical protein VTK26DRAFT_4630 [Humicola hyalothermophila]